MGDRRDTLESDEGRDVAEEATPRALDPRARICPLCDVPSADEICPVHDVPTLRADFKPRSVAPLPGQLIAGRYRIERNLGAGGMGTVFAASQLGMGRTVALKMLRPHLITDLRHVKRFYREAQVVTQLHHPNIVRVFDFGIDDGCGAPFLALELVRGPTIGVLIRDQGTLPEARATGLLAQAAKALIEAHQKGLVHRDLKPANLMVEALPDGDEHLKVLDFGIIKMVSASTTDPGEPVEPLTTVGAVVGTPSYMSPEQILNGRLDFRSDLYSLGCILHEMLTGMPPFFDEGGSRETMRRQVAEPPPPLPSQLADGRPPSEALRQLCSMLLEKEPSQRPGSTAEAARMLVRLAAPGAEASGEIATVREVRGLSPANPSGDSDEELATTVPSAPRAALAAGSASGLRTAEAEGSGRGDAAHPAGRGFRTALGLLGAALLAAGAVAFWLRPVPAPLPAPVPVALPVALPTPVALPPPVALPAPLPSALPAPPAAHEPAPLRVLTHAPEPPPPAAPEARRVRLRSEPAGAEVFEDGRLLGTTPLELEAPSGALTRRLRLKKPGFAEQALDVEARSGPEVAVRLTAARAKSVPRNPAPPTKNAVPLW
jgi:serine/threonine-protein kinase